MCGLCIELLYHPCMLKHNTLASPRCSSSELPWNLGNLLDALPIHLLKAILGCQVQCCEALYFLGSPAL